MFSVKFFSQKNVSPPDPIIQSLSIDSNGRLWISNLGASILGLLFLWFAYSFKAPVIFYPAPISHATDSDHGSFTTMILPDKVKQHPKGTLKRSLPKQATKVAHGNPKAEINRLAVMPISSQIHGSSNSAWEALASSITHDVDKLIDNASIISRNNGNRIGDGRRGRMSVAGPGSPEGGDVGAVLAGIWPQGERALIETKVKVEANSVGVGTSAIELEQNSSQRSSESILLVIRAHIRGLRHIYNRFLLKHSGFKGKITARMEISPRGEVVALSVVSSTTQLTEFDQAILQNIRQWRFEPIHGQMNDFITVPFNFSE